MNNNTGTGPRALSRGDTIGMLVFMLAGITIAVSWITASVIRIIEVLPNHDVALPATFAGTRAEAPIGPDGASVSVILDTATIIAPSLPVASLVSLIIQQVIGALAVTIFIACLLILSRNIIRGQIFSRRNTVLVTVAGFVGIGGFVAVPFFGNMAANGAFARLSDGDFENVIMSVDVFTFIFLGFIVALAATVFSVGERIQRDTEGLV